MTKGGDIVGYQITGAIIGAFLAGFVGIALNKIAETAIQNIREAHEAAGTKSVKIHSAYNRQAYARRDYARRT